jgi:hypothetical protein
LQTSARHYSSGQLRAAADQIPSAVGIGLITEEVQYTALRIRDSEFLLPLHGETEALDSSGNLSRNDLSLTQCREFIGESSVTFGSSVDARSTDGAVQKR